MSRYRQTMSEALKEVRAASDLKEFKKMTVTFTSMDRMAKASTDLAKKGFTIDAKGLVMKVDGKGADLNKYAADLKNFYGASKIIAEQDEKDHEISMARGELEAIADKALKLSSILQGKSDEDNIEAWVQSKITKAKDYINSVADYMEYNPDVANEETIVEYTQQQIKMAYGILNDPRYRQGNYTGAVAAIEKLAKGLSKHPDVANALKRANEELEEAFSDAQVAVLKKAYMPMKGQKISLDNANKLMAIFNKFDKDKGALEKLVKANIPFVSDLAVSRLISKHNYTADKLRPLKAGYMSEGTMIGGIIKHQGQPSAEYNKARLQYRTFMAKPQPAKGAEDKVLKFVFDDELLDDLYTASQKTPTKDVRPIVKARLMKLGIKEELEEAIEDETPEEKPEVKKEKTDDKEKLKAELEKKDDEIAMLKTKAETEKAKVAKKETEKLVNPETGEPLLQVGIAYKHLKDKMQKESLDEKFTKKDYARNEDENEHSLNALELVKMFGTPQEKKDMQGIYDRHMKRGHITEPDYSKRNAYDKKYYGKLRESIEEGRMSDIDAMRKKGASAAEIAKELKLPVRAVKDILGEVKVPVGPDTDDINDKKVAIANDPKKGEKKIVDPKPKINEGAKLTYESIAAVKKKAQQTGMPYSVLKQVYDRGMAAWRGGHRPGATQVQWALARVNSFVTKSSGTWGGADKDLAAKVKGE